MPKRKIEKSTPTPASSATQAETKDKEEAQPPKKPRKSRKSTKKPVATKTVADSTLEPAETSRQSEQANNTETTPAVESNDQLPPEILEHIFEYVGLNTRFVCSQVCKSWRVVATDEIFWKGRCEALQRTVQHNKSQDKSQPELWFQLFITEWRHILCTSCEGKKGKPFKWTKERLCDDCRSLKKYQVITKSEAVSHYRLREEHLDELFCVYTNNRYRRDAPIRLYLRTQVREMSLRVHGSKEARLNSIQKSKERSAKAQKTRQDNMNRRMNELTAALQAQGLTLRNDSRLCQGYINGSVKTHSVEMIVEVMLKHKMLYEQLHCHKRFKRWVKNRGIEECRLLEKTISEAREQFKDRLWDAYQSGKLESFKFSLK